MRIIKIAFIAASNGLDLFVHRKSLLNAQSLLICSTVRFRFLDGLTLAAAALSLRSFRINPHTRSFLCHIFAG
jgi:hypothetical protein